MVRFITIKGFFGCFEWVSKILRTHELVRENTRNVLIYQVSPPQFYELKFENGTL